MGWTDYGLEKLGSWIGGEQTSRPQYVAFGTGSSPFTGSVYWLDDEITDLARKQITWSWEGNKIKGTVILTAGDAIGSNIQEIGMASGSSNAGSDLFVRDLSAIGDKTADFDVTITLYPQFTRE